MSKFPKWQNALASVAAIAAVLLASPVFVSAQNIYRGLVVRLPGQDDFYVDYLYVKPGDRLTGEFILQHEFEREDEAATFYVFAADFEVDSDGVKTIEPENGSTLESEFSIARNVTFDKLKVTLDRYGSKETIKYTINVPTSFTPGLRYTRILASTSDPKLNQAEEVVGGTGAGIVSRVNVATLLVSVGQPSDYRTAGELENIGLTDIDGNPGIFGWLFDLTPISVTARINNTGNQALLLGGNVTWHGGDPTKPYDFQKFNEERQRVLPGKSRNFTNSWRDGLMYANKRADGTVEYVWDLQGDLNTRWGKHYVELRINYKDQNGDTKFIIENIEFWVLPWKAILLAVIVIIAYIAYRRFKSNRAADEKSKKPVAKKSTTKK
jgi:hypothetical protein